MALGVPIVSTAVPEARKYTSVRIANTGAQFVACVSAALANSADHSCRRSILAEARKNDWMTRAAAIRQLVGAHRAFHSPDEVGVFDAYGVAAQHERRIG